MAILYNFGRYDNSKDLVDTIIAYEKLYLIKNNKSNPIKFGKKINFSDIQSLPLALPSHPHTLNTVLSEMSLKQGVKINIAAEVNSFTGMIELSKAGYYTLSPMVSIKDEIKRGELIAIGIVNPELYWTVHLVARKEGSLSQPISAIHNLIIEIINSLIESGEWEADMV